jgi:hypothetical protein
VKASNPNANTHQTKEPKIPQLDVKKTNFMASEDTRKVTQHIVFR